MTPYDSLVIECTVCWDLHDDSKCHLMVHGTVKQDTCHKLLAHNCPAAGNRFAIVA